MKYYQILKVLFTRFSKSFVASWNALAYNEASWIRSVAKTISKKHLGGPKNEFSASPDVIEVRKLAKARFNPELQAEFQRKVRDELNTVEATEKEMQDYVNFLTKSVDDPTRIATHHTAVEVYQIKPRPTVDEQVKKEFRPYEGHP